LTPCLFFRKTAKEVVMQRLRSFPRAAYVFDKDGTLLDTETLYFEAFCRLLAPYGARHDHRTHRTMMGSPPHLCLEILQRRHKKFPQGPQAIPFLLKSFKQLTAEVRRAHGVAPMPGALAFLERCLAKGIRLAMATSAPRENTEADLARLQIKGWFETVITGDDVKRYKPAPDIFLEAARRLGVDPRECTAFEDGLHGARSAADAGMHVVFLSDKRFGTQPSPQAHLALSSFTDFVMD
jgi:beta-phosphoglucomutase